MYHLTEQQVADFNDTGFLVIESLIDQRTLEELRVAYEELLQQTIHADGDRMLGGITRQVMYPSSAHSTFDSNPAVDAASEIAEQLLGRTTRHFDMLIYKPPGHPHETPWHQDRAYTTMPFTPAGTAIPLQTIQFWVALDDADAENGCMHFVPRQQVRPLLSHYVAAGDPNDEGRLLAIEDLHDLDLTSAVCAAIPAGGCTMHSYGTPHYTPPNRSTDRPRRAYIFTLGAADSMN